jgi:hypothetical protein
VVNNGEVTVSFDPALFTITQARVSSATGSTAGSGNITVTQEASSGLVRMKLGERLYSTAADESRLCLDVRLTRATSPASSPQETLVTAALGDSCGFDRASSAYTIRLAAPTLRISKECSVDESLYACTVIVSRPTSANGQALGTTASSVVVGDFLPVQLTLVPASVSPAEYLREDSSLGASRMVFELPPIDAGTSVTLRYSARLNEYAMVNRNINNVAVATYQTATVVGTPFVSVSDNHFYFAGGFVYVPPEPSAPPPPPTASAPDGSSCVSIAALRDAGLGANEVAAAAAGPSSAQCSALPVPVSLYASDLSVATSCAEEDNIGIAVRLSASNTTWPSVDAAARYLASTVSGFSVMATHPRYTAPFDPIHDADFTSCSMLDRRVVAVGTLGGTSADVPFGSANADGMEFFAPTIVPDSVPEWAREPCIELDASETSAFPSEINSDWLRSFYVHFTTLNPHQHGVPQTSPGAEVQIGIDSAWPGNDGAGLQVDISVFSRTANDWITLGTRQLGDTSRIIWTVSVPDYTWSEGCFANTLRVQVLSAPGNGAYAQLTYLGVVERPGTGETAERLYSGSHVFIDAVDIVWWWLSPKRTTITIALEDDPSMVVASTTNAAYFRVTTKLINLDSWVQSFVLYQDGYLRLKPLPLDHQVDSPFGSSVIIGVADATRVPRPYAPISSVHLVISDNPVNPVSGRIMWDDGTEMTFELTVNSQMSRVDFNVVQVSYDFVEMSTHNPATGMIVTPPLATLRSMHVRTDNADGSLLVAANTNVAGAFAHPNETLPTVVSSSTTRVDLAVAESPASPTRWRTALGDWTHLTRACPSRHNTDAPDMTISLRCNTGADSFTILAGSATSSTASGTSTQGTIAPTTNTPTVVETTGATDSTSNTTLGAESTTDVGTTADTTGEASGTRVAGGTVVDSAADDGSVNTTVLIVSLVLCFNSVIFAFFLGLFVARSRRTAAGGSRRVQSGSRSAAR